MSTIVVTGAPGWLGTRMVRSIVEGLPDFPELKEVYAGRKIRCLTLEGVDVQVLREISHEIELITGDLRDPASLAPLFEASEGGTLFHLAGVIHPKRLRDLHDINVTGVENALQAAADAGLRRAVVISSNCVAGYSRDPDILFDEESPDEPFMTYGKSKSGLEAAVRNAHDSGRIETVIIRPCWFYGPDQPPRQTEFFHMIRDGGAPIIGEGLNKRSLSYVDNSCQALALADRKDEAAGQTYWVADRRPYAMSEIVDTVERLLEEEFDIEVAHKRLRLPGLACEVALMADWCMQKVNLYQKHVHVLSEMNKTIACSVEKAERELGYDPKVSLEEGMRRSLVWCRDRGLL